MHKKRKRREFKKKSVILLGTARTSLKNELDYCQNLQVDSAGISLILLVYESRKTIG
jgi:hypothetical protein